MLGSTELIIVALAVGLFFFGKGKMIDWAKSLGEAKRAFSERAIDVKEVEKNVNSK